MGRSIRRKKRVVFFKNLVRVQQKTSHDGGIEKDTKHGAG